MDLKKEFLHSPPLKKLKSKGKHQKEASSSISGIQNVRVLLNFNKVHGQKKIDSYKIPNCGKMQSQGAELLATQSWINLIVLMQKGDFSDFLTSANLLQRPMFNLKQPNH